MIDLDAFRHRIVPLPAPERATKTGAYDVRRTPWGEEWTPSTSDRSAKAAAPLVKGARSVEESRILTVLRSAPGTSIADIARRTGLPEVAAQLAWRSLMHRELVREEAGLLGTIRLVAVAMANG